MENFYQRVYDLVRRIPAGRVMTYGQIAVLLRKPTAARAVGYALHSTPAGQAIPWQRVINAQGKISPRSAGDKLHEPPVQRLLLEAEGIEFTAQGAIDLSRYLWEPEPENGDDWTQLVGKNIDRSE
jgi:methylated-DNA-protein-cysteine methyltransferase related protein